MPSMTHWNERQAYDVVHDCVMARISGFDEHQREHWTLIQVASEKGGMSYRERRLDAIFAVQDAIEAGHEPGEVK